MQLFPSKSLVFVVHFLNAFWHGKETVPKISSQNETVSFLIVFHFPYSKYKGVKICFYLCRYKIKIFHSCRTRVVRLAIVLYSYRQCSTRVALTSHLCQSCLTHVALVSLVSHSCCIRVARVALLSLMSGTLVVNQTRSQTNVVFFLNQSFLSIHVNKVSHYNMAYSQSQYNLKVKWLHTST